MTGPPSDDHATSFGARRVEEAEKARLVRNVFDRVAGRYDLMNDLMSAGVHRLWKAEMVRALAPRPDWSTIDVAGGTGDIAFRLAGRVRHTTLVDVNEAMLSVGRDRALDRGLVSGLAWVAGDAEALPLAAGRFDAYTIAFGIRNVTHIERALAEARRVLRPGGRFACLEFSRLLVPALERAYDAYSFTVLPALGRLVAGDADSYRYLAESIRRFPDQAGFAAMIEEAGLSRVRVTNLTGGIAALHTAWKI